MHRLFALSQKDHLAKRSCFWNLFNLSSSARCIWAEKQKNACRNCLWISALLEMEMWRNCKNKRGRLSHLNHELLKRDKRTDKFLHNFLKIAFLLGTNTSTLWGGKWLVMNPAWLDGACGRYWLWSSSLWADVNVDGVKISNIVWHKGRCFYDEQVFRWIGLNRCQDYTLVLSK